MTRECAAVPAAASLPSFPPSSPASLRFVFQPQYYDMPRVPGSRIESPATLGRKCWAFAYLAEIWANVKAPLLGSVAASGSGQDLNSMVGAYESAVAMSMPLCDRVMANCFVNASYNPAARNGTCHDASLKSGSPFLPRICSRTLRGCFVSTLSVE